VQSAPLSDGANWQMTGKQDAEVSFVKCFCASPSDSSTGKANLVLLVKPEDRTTDPHHDFDVDSMARRVR
jgi:hypothetical protein